MEEPDPSRSQNWTLESENGDSCLVSGLDSSCDLKEVPQAFWSPFSSGVDPLQGVPQTPYLPGGLLLWEIPALGWESGDVYSSPSVPLRSSRTPSKVVSAIEHQFPEPYDRPCSTSLPGITVTFRFWLPVLHTTSKHRGYKQPSIVFTTICAEDLGKDLAGWFTLACVASRGALGLEDPVPLASSLMLLAQSYFLLARSLPHTSHLASHPGA